jgi:hypothetical protein
MGNISTLAIIITVLLTLITIIMTTVSMQMFYINKALKGLSDRVIVIETEHKNRNNNCGNSENEIYRELRNLLQTFKIYEELKKKEHG